MPAIDGMAQVQMPRSRCQSPPALLFRAWCRSCLLAAFSYVKWSAIKLPLASAGAWGPAEEVGEGVALAQLGWPFYLLAPAVGSSGRLQSTFASISSGAYASP